MNMNSESRTSSLGGGGAATPPNGAAVHPHASADEREMNFERVVQVQPSGMPPLPGLDPSLSHVEPVKNTSADYLMLQQLHAQQQQQQGRYSDFQGPGGVEKAGGLPTYGAPLAAMAGPLSAGPPSASPLPSWGAAAPTSGATTAESPGQGASTASSARRGSKAGLPRSNATAFRGKGSFPLNLTLMLESVESMGLSHIVAWLPNGQSFVIHDPDQFLSVVLPKFFKSSKNTKIRSFYRKLNRWGFSILRNQHLSHQGVGTMKGVWNHPDFYRARAIECMRIAMESGDTGCFLALQHCKAEDAVPRSSMGGDGGGEDTNMTSGTKRRGSSSPLSSSLRDSSTTEGTELPSDFFGAPQGHRPSHRESDFSVGNESLDVQGLYNTQHLGEGFLSLHVPPEVSQVGSLAQTNPAAAAYGSSLCNSFTNGQTSHMQPSADAMMHHKRGRMSVNLATGPTSSAGFHRYQPISQSGAHGGRNVAGVSASWTAGSTLSQHDYNFAPYPFQANSSSIQEGPSFQDPMLGPTNGNVDTIEELFASTGMEFGGPRPPPAEGAPAAGQEGEEVSPEDAELATFFERFAESLQK